MADRFFCPDLPSSGDVALIGDEAHHLARVRRLEPGAIIELFDGRGHACRAKVESLGRNRVDLQIVAGMEPDPPPVLALTLATAVPKGDRFDWLIEKATEIGVDRLVPLITERSVVDPRGAKLDRLRRSIIEASKQSGRNRLMDLAPPTAWSDYLRAEQAPTRLIAHPGGSPGPSWVLDDLKSRVALAIGPEGGFTDVEVESARGSGWKVIVLGPTILRIETAGLVGSALILARNGPGRGDP